MLKLPLFFYIRIVSMLVLIAAMAVMLLLAASCMHATLRRAAERAGSARAAGLRRPAAG